MTGRGLEDGASAVAASETPGPARLLAPKTLSHGRALETPRPVRVQGFRVKLGPWLRRIFVHHILHLDDTPGRIALGVFIGFVVGATPTLGLQMVIYFALVAFLPANKVSGLLPIWITNPLTAVPIYYGNWRFGGFVMTGHLEASEASRAAIARLIEGPSGAHATFLERMSDPQFWAAALEVLRQIGVELWVGSLLVGLVTGLVGYVATYMAIQRYRARRRLKSRPE